MNKKTTCVFSDIEDALDLTAAVEQFVAQGGVIDRIPIGDSSTGVSGLAAAPPGAEETAGCETEKAERLRELIAKGAGMSALQYSLKMNKSDIRQLATENGLKIVSSRPMAPVRRVCRHDTSDVDDTVAGHAMHYSSLGYSALEIAQKLGLSIRQVWDMGKAYRFEFKQKKDELPHTSTTCRTSTHKAPYEITDKSD